MRNTVLVALLIGWTARAEGQLRPYVGMEKKGGVVVEIYAVLSDTLTPYRPLTDFVLIAYRNERDSIVLRTDDAGRVFTVVPPGDYRLISRSAVTWHGQRYAWSVPFSVRPGMSNLELTPANAIRGAAALRLYAERWGASSDGRENARVYDASEVDIPVAVGPTAPRPVYPDRLRLRAESGEVIAEFVVDTAGRVERGSVRILRSSHPLFSDAVRDALGGARYRPARIDGRPVRQRTQEPFVFSSR